MKEYKLSKSRSTLIYVGSSLSIAFFCWVFTLSFQDLPFPPKDPWVFIPISLVAIGILTGILIDTYKTAFIIDENKIISISIFYRRELAHDEIKGYTSNSEGIFIESKNKNKKNITISTYTDNTDDIMSWLVARFSDLNSVAFNEEEHIILSDETLGSTTELREGNLTKARSAAKTLKWIAVLVAVWILVYPAPYVFCILTGMLIPIAAIAYTRLSRGLIRFDTNDKSAYPSVALAIVFPALCLMLRAFFDYQIAEYANAWISMLVLTLALALLALVRKKELTFKKSSDYVTALTLTFFFMMYSFGTILQINCYNDQSLAGKHKTKILSKRMVHSRKTDSYYFRVSAEGQPTEMEEVQVEKPLFNKLQSGDVVNIYLWKGRLDIPWYTVSD